MSDWALHFLNARGALDPYLKRVGEASDAVRGRAASVTALPALDIVVQATDWVIPELGHMGYSPRPGVIQLSLDPENENLPDSLGESLERMIAHELHHAIRWDGPGYGTTLGEAVVSEGLAGQFVAQLYNSKPELWEAALDDLSPYLELLNSEWDKQDYDHMRWFYGSADLPRWTGYSAGYRLAGMWLERNGETAASAAHQKAGDFRLCLDA